MPAIEVARLTKSYGRARGVVDLTFSVERGEIFGYLGPNGAGKTTTIRTLLDFIRPSGGRAIVLGLDARRDAVEIHRRIGYLPGEYGLVERFTGLEQLTYLGRSGAASMNPSCETSPTGSISTWASTSRRSPTETNRRSG